MFTYRFMLLNKMKIRLVIALLFTLSYASAQNAPDIVQKAFDERYPGASDVNWEKEIPRGWIAEFVWNSQNMKVNYTLNGIWVSSQTQIPQPEIPEQVYATINSFYPDWKIVLATKIESGNGDPLYKAAIQKEMQLQEIIVKSDGTLMMVGLK